MLTQTITDQMGRTITVNNPPKRIVSLVPSQTELLYQLGLTHEVVGQTLFCIHPADMHQTKPRVGGTKKVKMDVIASLQPDLIIGNKEENDQADITQLMAQYPVWMSDIKNLNDALDMIMGIGQLVGKPHESSKLAQTIQQSFNAFKVDVTTPKPALYLIWRNPWMAAGHSTFITEMMHGLGLQNVASQQQSRYPELTANQIAKLNPEVILLSSEPYPFKEKHLAELQVLCPQAKILLVDGELFSWYGSRLLHSVAYFKQLLPQLTR